ncbi:Npt1/Npt2 family nucleotide transporter [Candidatus Nesciobacter abundans]|uniref:ADP,ATP carrier protein n=1 Tax=Candidatus Nesciobacter abundans TaxID=2601668 RepID=A0A5C0UGL9_9PROT|nr:Npt1/Npt2 family nucleotide transporter [Candidatus Nesciobacter abundans]QEK39265.1 hypothetical protein FZC36_02425 [Candidatus Nesciobacter abundans]
MISKLLLRTKFNFRFIHVFIGFIKTNFYKKVVRFIKHYLNKFIKNPNKFIKNPNFDCKAKRRIFSSLSNLSKNLFPVKKSEFKKFFPMAFMMFFMLFSTTILKNVKDTLIITHKGSGAEVINFLKFFVVIFSILFMSAYGKLSQFFESKNMFYVTISFFLLFFLFFNIVLYPNRETLHPNMLEIKQIKALYPRLKWILPMYSLWIYSIFYAFADLWCSMCISFLFWQFANQVVTLEESKRFYGSFAAIGYIGLIIGSKSIKYIINSKLGSFDQKLRLVIYLVCIACCFIMFFYFLFNKIFHSQVNFKSKKSKFSLRQSIKIIFQNKTITYIMAIVFCYNFSISMVELTWKSELRNFTKSKEAFVNYYAFVNESVGYSTIFFAFFSNILFKKINWFGSALITPVVMLVSSLLFFSAIILKIIGFKTFLGASIVVISVLTGTIHNITSKSMKYSLFDQTKEMAYIPLDKELKTKGKAAIDVVGSRFSKSLSGQIQAFLLILIPQSSQINIAPYLLFLIIIVFYAWFWSLNKLNLERSKDLHK